MKRLALAFLFFACSLNAQVQGRWTPLANPTWFDTFTIDPVDTNRLYASYSDGVYKSTNGGVSWTAISFLNSDEAGAIIVNPLNTDTLYAGVYAVGTGGQGVFRSSNRGNSWTNVYSSYSVKALACDRQHPNLVYAGTVTNYWWGAGVGMIKTTDAGSTWTEINNGLGNLEINEIAVGPTNGSTVYVGTESGIYRSLNGGALWEPIVTGLPGGVIVRKIAVDPIDPKIVYLGTQGDGLYKSSDAGQSWAVSGTGITDAVITSLAINPDSPFIVYAGTQEGGLFKSTNGGALWSAMDANGIGALWMGEVGTIVLNPRNPRIILAMFAVGTTAAQIYTRLDEAAGLRETEPNNTSGQANQINLGDVIDGAFSVVGDVDYFRINLSAGDTIDIAGSNTAGSTADGLLRLYDESGNLLEQNDDYLSTADSRIIYAISANGTYYIRYCDYTTAGDFPNSLGKRSSFQREDAATIGHSTSFRKNEHSLAQIGSYNLTVKRLEASAPQVVAYNAFDIFSTSASFDGYVFPNQLFTTLTVQYGTTTSYGQSRQITSPQEFAGAYFADSISALSPNTTYNYQIVATNSLGSSSSENHTFDTPSPAAGWVRVRSGVGEFFVSIAFADANVGMIVGDNGVILKTTDGGRSWASQTSGTYEVLRGLCMVNLTQAYVVGNGGMILRTDNGGSTWVSQSSGETTLLSDVHFMDGNTGVVVGNSGTILRTTNGGSSWQLQPSGTVQSLRGLDFVNASLGVAVGYGGTILRTTDGGKSWSSVTSPTSEVLYRVDLVNASVGYAVGFNGVILKTYDGGFSWVQQTVGTSESFYNLSFRDENNGLATATNGEIWRTSDGGASWSKDESGTWNGLNCAAITSDGTLIIGGDYGTILRKTEAVSSLTVTLISPNGGEAWNEDLLHRVAWLANDGTGNTITGIRLLYSTDNGVSFTEFFNGAPSPSSRVWQIPRAPTNAALVKVVVTNSNSESAEDVSDGLFAILDVNTYVHRSGAMAHTLRNDGYTGSGSRTFDVSEPSLEFPQGSGRDHLYVGELLLAGVTAAGDTLANFPYEDAFSPLSPIVPTTFSNYVETRSRFSLKDVPDIQVQQRTLGQSNEQFEILAYTVYNKSGLTLANAYLGLYSDFDVNDATNNLSGYEGENKLGYVYDASGAWTTYAGLRILNAPLSSFRRWSNTIVEPSPRGNWYKAIAGAGFDGTSTDAPSDYRVMECTGPFSLAPGDSLTLVVALGVGDGLNGVRQATSLAQQFWDQNFAGKLPSVVTDVATSVGSTSAVLNATVDPVGFNTAVYFEYGPSTSYGTPAAATGSPFTGTGPQSVKATVSGLNHGTTYHYRAIASNANGIAIGSDQTFTTTVVATITVTTTPVVWATGFKYSMSWVSSNLSGDVNIGLSTDGGNTYVTLLPNAQNIGSASVTVPASTTPSTNCKLRVESVATAAVYGESGTFTIVSGTLPSTIQLSGNVTFGSDLSSSTSYRLVSLPGNVGSLSVGDVLTGSQKTDWRIYEDNGASSNFLQELSGASTFDLGQGYWLLKRGGLSVSRSVPAALLESDATCLISLHSGWNIIGDPFNRSVSWSAILAANGLTSAAANRIQAYAGSYSTASSLDPYQGYYFFNGGNLSSLKIPYPFLGKVEVSAQQVPIDWKIRLDFRSDINDDPENFIGIAPTAKEGIDDLESHKPPLFMDQGFLYFERPDWDRSFSLFSSDFRPLLGEGQVWDFTVRNPRRSVGTICFSGVEGVPMEYDVKLVNLSNIVPVDLRTAAEYSYRAAEEITHFRLIIGKKAYVEDQLASVLPEAFDLLQNFPNPFNAGTTIVFRTPKESHVQLKIVSLLGQTVSTLMDHQLMPGTYTVRWEGRDQNGRQVASGVYFYQLISDGKPVETKKLTILK